MSALASIQADFERFSSLIDRATLETIPDSGDRVLHVQDLAAQIIALDPQLFGTVSALLSAGDVDAATEAARAGLTTFGEMFPWLVYPADGHKRAYRACLRRWVPADHVSADTQAATDSITTARRELANIIAQRPTWDLAELEAEGEALRQADSDRAARAEAARLRKVAEDRSKREAEALRNRGLADNGFRGMPAKRRGRFE